MSGSGNTLSADEVRRSIDAQVVQEASDAGVDVDGVIESTIAERGDYGRRTVERFAVSALNRQIEAAASDTVSGILCGSRDRHGKNWPRRHALIKSDGDHLEASTWDGTLPTPDGTEVEIPAGAAVEIGLEHDSQYDSYEAKQLHSVQDLDRETLASRLASISKTPGDLSREDEYEIVAVRGELRFVNPQTIVEDGEPIELVVLAQKAWQTAQTEGATLEINVESQATVTGDRDLLLNVFENLFRNAVDHNEPPLVVRVGTLDETQQGFYIEDDGDGIPEDERETVFDHGHTTSADGTGLGLYIVNELISAHDWTIAVTDGSDGGARFEVRTETDGMKR
jgi:hypothetical protein